MVGVHVADHDRAEPVVVDVAAQVRERAACPGRARSGVSPSSTRYELHARSGRGIEELDPATVSRAVAVRAIGLPRGRRRRGPRRRPAATPSRSSRPSRRERRALDADALLAVHVLLDDDPERVADRRRGVGQQLGIGPYLVANFFCASTLSRLTPTTVAPAASKSRLRSRNAWDSVGAARRVGLGIEVDDELAAGEIAQPHVVTVLVRRRRRPALSRPLRALILLELRRAREDLEPVERLHLRPATPILRRGPRDLSLERTSARARRMLHVVIVRHRPRTRSPNVSSRSPASIRSTDPSSR